MKEINNIFLRYFYLGNFKYAPGSFSSFIILLIWFFIPNNMLLQLSIILFHIILGFYFCYRFNQEKNLEEDPNYIVIDEVVGMMLSLFLFPKTLLIYSLAFILFRFFDILKPSLINRSQEYKYGIGIMMDDIIAGLLTFLIISGLLL